jgi:coenzyme F420-reducing hydrogenase delta subunit
MQLPRPTGCHSPRRAATEAPTLSVLRRLIRAVKGVCKPGVDPSRAAVVALGALPIIIGSADVGECVMRHQSEHHKMQIDLLQLLIRRLTLVPGLRQHMLAQCLG